MLDWHDILLRLRRIPGAGRRHLLDLFPAREAATRARAAAAHRPSLRAAGPLGAILAAVTADAICRTALGDLGLGGLLDDPALPLALASLRTARRPGKSVTRLHHGELPELPSLYLAGLHPQLVALAESYFRLPAIYLGYEIKAEHPDGRATGTRLWHRDVEDRNVLKLLVYLSDTSDSDGALEYVEADASERFCRISGYRAGLLEIAAPLGAAACPGGRGTAILFDGARLLHRARPPAARERLSITFGYATRLARQVMPQQRPGRQLRHRVIEADPGSVAVLP